MSLPVRVIVILGGSVVTAGGGIWAGTVGARQIRRAQRQIDRQTAAYDQRYGSHLSRVDQTNDLLRRLGDTQERALAAVIHRMRDYLERHERLVKASEHLILDGLDDANVPVVGLTRLPQDVTSWARGIVGSVGAGVATSGAMKATIARFGKASTGSAIASLQGIAAKNAAAAWWGGGSLASGGGGMALGKVVQQAPLVGPAVLIAGLTVKNQGTKAKTSAEQHRVEVALETARLDLRDEKLRAVDTRAGEVDGILSRLIEEAVRALDALESKTTDAIPPEPFQRAMILVKSVRDVATAPIADEQGELDEHTDELIMRFRAKGKKARRG